MKKLRAHFLFFFIVGMIFFPMIATAYGCASQANVEFTCSGEECSSEFSDSHSFTDCDCSSDCHYSHCHVQLFLSQNKNEETFFSKEKISDISYQYFQYSIINEVSRPPRNS